MLYKIVLTKLDLIKSVLQFILHTYVSPYISAYAQSFKLCIIVPSNLKISYLDCIDLNSTVWIFPRTSYLCKFFMIFRLKEKAY